MTANQLSVFPLEQTLTASPIIHNATAGQSDLPTEWQWVKLDDVCEKILGGGTPSTKNTDYWNGNIDWITSADIYGINDMSKLPFSSCHGYSVVLAQSEDYRIDQTIFVQ
ncbi:restriction endonuclease subunit S [Spirosoma linguale]|uniref:Type I restriction modification DNA specificity domain-containing protein n=1 Tax=Spirosoma linguale (strain ATCC 33905 / DSM 74 / LMG 10896 / Claus 1) TaxID=504472 RepID=D2QUZ5_SPILD|nr:hypothetical protein Slin_6670 [Spirosoma linguale DSM 74]